MTERALLRCAEYASACGVSVETVRRWCRTGAVPNIKRGRLMLIPASALDVPIPKAPPEPAPPPAPAPPAVKRGPGRPPGAKNKPRSR